MVLGKNTGFAQIRFVFAAFPFESLAPAIRHPGNSLGCTSQVACQCVLCAPVDNSLGFDALPSTQGVLLQQNGFIVFQVKGAK